MKKETPIRDSIYNTLFGIRGWDNELVGYRGPRFMLAYIGAIVATSIVSILIMENNPDSVLSTKGLKSLVDVINQNVIIR